MMERKAAEERCLISLKKFANENGISIQKIKNAFEIGSKYLIDDTDSEVGTLRLIQTIKQKAYQDALKEIGILFSNKRINFILLKGFSLNDDLFSAPQNRVFGDLDLLISISQIEKAVLTLLENGYIGEYGSTVTEIVGKNSDRLSWVYNGHNHASAMKKSYVVAGIECVVSVELHISPILLTWEIYGKSRNETAKYLSWFNQLWNRRRWSAERRCYWLSREDMWIFLIMHMVNNHVCLPLTRYMVGHIYTNEASTALYLLVDIAIMWYLHSDSMDWEYIDEIVSENQWHLSFEYVYRLIEDIFGIKQQFPQNKLLIDTKNNQEIVIKILNDTSTTQLIIGDIFHIMHIGLLKLSEGAPFLRKDTWHYGVVINDEKSRLLIERSDFTVINIELSERAFGYQFLVINIYYDEIDLPMFCEELLVNLGENVELEYVDNGVAVYNNEPNIKFKYSQKLKFISRKTQLLELILTNEERHRHFRLNCLLTNSIDGYTEKNLLSTYRVDI